MTPWLSVEGMSKSYGGIRALAGVSFDLRDGEVHGLIGPNGAGKSTLINCISGIVEPDEGSLVLEGQHVRLRCPADAASQGIQAMPQELCVVPDLTVAQNLLLGAEPRRLGLLMQGRLPDRAMDVLEMLGMADLRDAQVGGISAAHKRLTMMGRACYANARLLILDEPTAGLPPEQSQIILAATKRVRGHGVSVIYVSHHLDEVLELADRVTAIRSAKVSAHFEGAAITRSALVNELLDVPKESEWQAESNAVRHEPSVDDPGDARASLTLHSVSTEILEEVDLTVSAGEVLGVAGLLGSGVDHVVDLLLGVLQPQFGELRIGGLPVLFSSPRHSAECGVGFVSGYRESVAIREWTIRENATLGCVEKYSRWGLISRKQESAAVDASLRSLEMSTTSERRLGSLSGGNQQRALFTKLLLAQSQFAVLKEPTVGVDISARRALWLAIIRMAQSRAVVLASSDPEELLTLSDRIACFKKGRLVAVIPRSEASEQVIVEAIG